MKRTALVLCNDSRFSRFLVTELGYLGVVATTADASELFSKNDVETLSALADANDRHLLVVDGDTCSDAVRRWIAHNAPCPLLSFARQEKNLPPVSHAGLPSLSLRRPFSIADFDGAVHTLLSLGDTEGVCPRPFIPAARSSGSADQPAITQGDGVATVQGHSVPLTATESAILACLLAHRGKLVSRDALATLTGGGNSVDVYVCRLRRKLEKPLGIRLIHTVRGQGYRLG